MTTTEATSPSWKDRLLKQSVGIRQAEKLLQAAGLDRRGRLVERLVKKTQDGSLGQSTPDDPGADDVIQVGDNHYTVLPQDPAPHIAAAAPGTTGKTLATVAAALLAGAGGMWALSPTPPAETDPPPAVAKDTPGKPTTDSNTKYRLRLVD